MPFVMRDRAGLALELRASLGAAAVRARGLPAAARPRGLAGALRALARRDLAAGLALDDRGLAVPVRFCALTLRDRALELLACFTSRGWLWTFRRAGLPLLAFSFFLFSVICNDASIGLKEVGVGVKRMRNLFFSATTPFNKGFTVVEDTAIPCICVITQPGATPAQCAGEFFFTFRTLQVDFSNSIPTLTLALKVTTRVFFFPFILV